MVGKYYFRLFAYKKNEHSVAKGRIVRSVFCYYYLYISNLIWVNEGRFKSLFFKVFIKFSSRYYIIYVHFGGVFPELWHNTAFFHDALDIYNCIWVATFVWLNAIVFCMLYELAISNKITIPIILWYGVDKFLSIYTTAFCIYLMNR